MPPIAIIHLIIILESALRPSEIIVYLGNAGLQKFAAVHASIHNHFNLDRHLNSRSVYKKNRSAALAEWRQLVK